MLERYDYPHDALSSVLLIKDGMLHRKSRAALNIARHLDGAWPLLYYVFAWIPPLIADPVYDFVGNRRYRWFGRKEECWVPTEALQGRFLSDGEL